VPTDGEAWKELATRAPDRDPGLTVRARDHAELGVAVTSAASVPSSAEGGSDADLPLIRVADVDAPPASRASSEYEVLGLLGEGGMGRVLLARQRSLGRDVAIKVVKPEIEATATLGGLFEEARVTGGLEHPGIVPVHALGRDEAGRPVLVMKRVEGVSWRALAERRAEGADGVRSLRPDVDDPLELHVDVAMSACNALHYAHARGVVHRDVKLDNVMIGRFGEVVVVDWGIAIKPADCAQRRHGGTVGTPAYMAPELVVGDVAAMDARTDVYLLGATLHHALVGAARHAGANLHAVLFAAHESAPFEYDARVPAELAAILNRATSRDPAARFDSALALRAALADFRRHRGSTASSDEAAVRLEELRALVEGAEGDGDDHERRVHALMAECRFGFQLALRGWKGNEAALLGLARCLELSARHELRRRDVARARALLGELASPPPELVARADALAAELEAERVEGERLAALGKDQDLRIGGGAQVAIVAVLPLLALSVGAFLVLHGAAISTLQTVVLPLLAGCVFASAAFLARRRLTTAISRRAVAAIALLPFAAAAHRAVSLTLGAPTPAVLAGDLVISIFFVLLLSVTLARRVAWIAPVCAAGLVAVALRPASAVPIFGVTVGTSFSLLFVLWRRLVRS
jgi:serine/threonine-protein kinase